MSIDTEGYEMEILKSNNWNKYRPKIIILETIEKNKDGLRIKTKNDFKNYLEQNDYTEIADTFINTIYIEKQFAKKIKYQIKS